MPAIWVFHQGNTSPQRQFDEDTSTKRVRNVIVPKGQVPLDIEALGSVRVEEPRKSGMNSESRISTYIPACP